MFTQELVINTQIRANSDVLVVKQIDFRSFELRSTIDGEKWGDEAVGRVTHL
jgi:hypothetical protein